MDSRAFLAALGPATVRVLPLALLGWVIANLIVHRRIVWDTLWIVPLPTITAIAVAALLLSTRGGEPRARP